MGGWFYVVDAQSAGLLIFDIGARLLRVVTGAVFIGREPLMAGCIF